MFHKIDTLIFILYIQKSGKHMAKLKTKALKINLFDTHNSYLKNVL